MENVVPNCPQVEFPETIGYLSGINCHRLLNRTKDYTNPFWGFIHLECSNPLNDVLQGHGHYHVGLQLITYVVNGMIWSENVLLTDGMVQHIQSGLKLHHSVCPTKQNGPVELFIVWFWSSTCSLHRNSTEWTSEDVTVIREEDNSAELRLLAGRISDYEGPILTEPDVLFCELLLRRTDSGSFGQYKLHIPKEYTILIVYVWKSSRQNTMAIETYVSDSCERITRLPCQSVTLLYAGGKSLIIRLCEAMNDCRLLILGGQQIPNLEAVIARHRQAQNNLSTSNATTDSLSAGSCTSVINLCPE